jgi:tetratricopeptide (TPR) repeat protein
LDDGDRPVRVFISYAHGDSEHEELVQQFWVFLRTQAGIDARFDFEAAEKRQGWALWMTHEIRDADFVLIIASAAYKRRAEGDAGNDEGRGVQWEAQLIREELYRSREKTTAKLVPVVLPGGSAADIPVWLGPITATHYEVADFSIAGAEHLLRHLTSQAEIIAPPLGPKPLLPPKALTANAPASKDGSPSPRGGLRTHVHITAELEDEILSASVEVADTPATQIEGRVPESVWAAADYLSLPPDVAAERLAGAGRELADALLGLGAGSLVGSLVDRLRPGDGVDVVLRGGGAVLSLPIELLRLPTEDGVDRVPLCLLPGVTVRREVVDAPVRSPVQLPGPVKVLAAVAAPEETRTANPPLDVEAEMQAVVDAATPVAEDARAQVQILEVASQLFIGDALSTDSYHVLHLSAHGSADGVELETEDGDPQRVTATDLINELRKAGRPVPLIVLSACSTGGAEAKSMAVELIRHGADRVVAMQAKVSDAYATRWASAFYEELVRSPAAPVAELLARARYGVQQEISRDSDRAKRFARPEFWIPALFCAAGDAGLVDPEAAEEPLTRIVDVPAGGSVRELRLGELIGRRAELRQAVAILRRAPWAVDDFGATGGVLLAGIGGIGKTAVAGRLMGRLRGDGWIVAVHEGVWNPAGIFNQMATAIETYISASGSETGLATQQMAVALSATHLDERQKLELLEQLLSSNRVLLVLDDFEQNLTVDTQEFVDRPVAEVLNGLADAAATHRGGGALLVTCSYPLPDSIDVIRIDVPPLSPSELRRMFLRLPALHDLNAEDRTILVRSIGGHPRLIEFVDAMMRRGKAINPHVKERLNQLAQHANRPVSRPSGVADAAATAVELGAEDILIQGLLDLLEPNELEVLAQIAVSRAPMRPSDLAYALAGEPAEPGADLIATVERLTDLTLIVSGADIVMHPWTADLVTRHVAPEPARHERALAMRWQQRAEDGVLTYEDLLDIPRHLSALGQYDLLVDVAVQAAGVLPGVLSQRSYFAELGSLIPVTERAWILLADAELQAVIAVGNLQDATAKAIAIHKSVEERAEADPTNTEWQRDLSVSHSRLGDLARAAGDLTAARSAYLAGLDVATRLAEADPTNTEWQRDLSVSHNSVGDLARTAGDLIGAYTQYEAGLDIRTRLAEADPTNTEWQRDLSVSDNRLGDLAQAAGDLTAARSAYQAGLDIATRLADADPTNTEWQRGLSVSRDRLGDLAQAAGDLTAAHTQYQAGLDIATRLAEADPTNTEWQRDLSVSHSRLGDLARAAGDLTAARSAYQAGLDIATRLAEADPTNTEWQRDLSVSHNRVGDLARAAGDLTAAHTQYQAGLDIRTRLAEADPTNTEWQRDLSVSHNRLGDLAQAAGDLTAARSAYQAGLDIRTRVLGPDHPDTLASRSKLAGAYQSAGDLGQAIALYEQTLDIRTRVLGPDHPDTLASRSKLAGAYLVTGNVVLVAGPEFPVVRGAVGRADLLRSLVDNGSHRPNEASRRTLEAIAAGDFDLVTRLLRAEGPDLSSRIRDAYSKPTSPTTYDALAQIPFDGVVTMNWDPALEDAFALRSHVVVRGGPDEALAAAKSQEFAFTWFAGDPRQEQVAIGPREIRARLQGNETLTRFLTGVVQSSILLFAGVRATDIIDFFEALPQLRSSPGKLGSGARRHFGICAKDELWQLNRSDLLNTYAVELIAYEPGGDHLTKVVHEFIGLAARSREITADQAAVPPTDGPLLSRIVLTNIGTFEELDLKLSPGWNLLLGNNGGGKSTILRAVALGLCGDHPSAIEAGSTLLRAGSDLGLIELQVGPSAFRTELRRSSDTVIVRTSSLTPLQQGHWAVLGFPPLRGISLVTPTGISATKAAEPRVEDLLPLVRGSVDDRLDDVKQWIINVEARSRRPDDVRSRQLLEEFFRVIGALTPGIEIAYDSVDPASWEVWVRTDDGVVPIDQLSQGMNSIIAWVGTLLQRMYDIYPDSDRPIEQPAFVLVDELDAHLHPAWQRLLPDLIRQRFPRVQFLATSHSPLMVSSLGPGELFVVARDTVPTTEGEERSVVTVTAVDVDPQGLRVDQILTSPLFGLLTSRSPAFGGQTDRYSELMRATSRSPADEEELQRLRSIIASSYRNGETAAERAIEAQQDAELDRSLGDTDLSTGNIAALRRLTDSLGAAEGEVDP